MVTHLSYAVPRELAYQSTHHTGSSELVQLYVPSFGRLREPIMEPMVSHVTSAVLSRPYFTAARTLPALSTQPKHCMAPE